MKSRVYQHRRQEVLATGCLEFAPAYVDSISDPEGQLMSILPVASRVSPEFGG